MLYKLPEIGIVKNASKDSTNQLPKQPGNDFTLLSLFTTFFFDVKVDFIDFIILKKKLCSPHSRFQIQNIINK